MPDAQIPRAGSRDFGLALVAGAVLALATGFGGSPVGAAIALIGGALSQPAFALAARLWKRRDAKPVWASELPALSALWGGATAATAALVAWPLSALMQSGSLLAALGLSVVAGLILLGLWRLWPLWQGAERDGAPLPPQWARLADLDLGAWRGLGVAAIVAGLAGAVVVLAWPGLLLDGARWGLAVVFAVASPALHVLLQSIAPAQALPGVEFDPELDTVHGAEDLLDDGEPLADAQLTPALYAAARAGKVERALELIELGADVNAEPTGDERDRRSLPVLAAVLPDLRLLRALIASGVDLNASHAGMTPLLAATRDSWHGRPDAVMTLLANGADPRLADFEGNTPLHHAARSSDPGVAALLRDAQAELEPLNQDGLSPLGVACASGNWRLAKFLLERGAKTEHPGGAPALLAAAGGDEDDPAGVQLLLKHKARIDARDGQRRSALHTASFAGHLDIVTTLLAAGADANAIDSLQRTPLLEAARGGRAAVLERLLEHLPQGGVAEAQAVDADGASALILACQAETASPPLVVRLLDLGIDPELRDRQGKRAVDRAAEAGRWSLVAALDRAYPLPTAVSGEGDSDVPEGERVIVDRMPAALLRDGLRDGRASELTGLAKLLSPAELGAQLHEEDGQVPTAERIEWLLGQGADVNVRNAEGDTVLFALLDRAPASLPALQMLLRHGVSPAGRGGLGRFLATCSAGDQAARGLEQFALDLLERGADPFACTANGDPALAIAVRLGWSRLLERLLTAGVDLNTRDSHGMSALHLAAALGREAMLKRLVANGAAPDLLAADGQTPLGVALASGRRDLADWLDWRGWPLPRRPLQPADVPAAAIVGDADAVRRLLDLGLSVDSADSQGCTSLLRAAGGGHRAVVDLLLARGADPQRAANSGATPLSAAVSMRHGEIVDRLVAAGASLEQRLPGDLTVLMVACALGLTDLAARLLTAGADVQARDAQGRMALHCAAMFGFTARERSRLVALFDTLLLAGVDADQSAAGATPLLLLLGARAEPGTAADEDVLIAGLELLLDHEASLNVQDPRGFGPLHLAALHGLLRVVQRLLRHGANPDVRDALNRTPREIAVMRGFVDIAAEFAPAAPSNGSNGGVSMARFLRGPGGG
ncbi:MULTISPECIES: ankyrin repeat domain-containing protein [Lysobacter]|uniref:ankyrin repeat domain-containing protein n=1 Tax=Lysobacter TaxID=68 RepID=UPI001F447736|nr:MULTISPECIES: ankyrin repeat domain-containing protein [Lysobacter]UJB19485.1 ankyrin repeat domain-containing protein [Lysobacter capsici]UJQ26789.1 ankyrin repeat domain-containing protein [Lysobacter gummosus]